MFIDTFVIYVLLPSTGGTPAQLRTITPLRLAAGSATSGRCRLTPNPLHLIRIKLALSFGQKKREICGDDAPAIIAKSQQYVRLAYNQQATDPKPDEGSLKSFLLRSVYSF